MRTKLDYNELNRLTDQNMKQEYIYVYIRSETILLRLQLFQYVNVPHQTKLTKCIVTIQK